MYGSSRFEYEIDVHGIIRKNNLALLCFLQNTRLQKRLNISMYGFDIPLHPAGCLSNSHWPCASHSLQQVPSFAGKYLEQ